MQHNWLSMKDFLPYDVCENMSLPTLAQAEEQGHSSACRRHTRISRGAGEGGARMAAALGGVLPGLEHEALDGNLQGPVPQHNLRTHLRWCTCQATGQQGAITSITIVINDRVAKVCAKCNTVARMTMSLGTCHQP
jgi:hypothetical protein